MAGRADHDDERSIHAYLAGMTQSANASSPSPILDAAGVDASGYNSVKLDELLTRDATIRVSGDASVRTSADGKVEIDGSGDTRVRLTRQPAELRQTLSGEAEVVTS